MIRYAEYSEKRTRQMPPPLAKVRLQWFQWTRLSEILTIVCVAMKRLPLESKDNREPIDACRLMLNAGHSGRKPAGYFLQGPSQLSAFASLSPGQYRIFPARLHRLKAFSSFHEYSITRPPLAGDDNASVSIVQNDTSIRTPQPQQPLLSAPKRRMKPRRLQQARKRLIIGS